jgi:recombination protein RecA
MKKGVEASQLDEFEKELISSLNKEHKDRIAYNLAYDVAPTNIHRWISTGSQLLDYIVSNRRDGGLPEGRIIEIFGPPSIGKSHIALQVAKSVQAMGGICVYIDTENATSIENLGMLGINIKKRFVFIETSCTEDIFQTIESIITKSEIISKKVPIVIIWDSVAASSPRAELDAKYSKDSIGLQARAMSKGLRKITGVIANKQVTLLCLNQTRTKIGVMFGDPMTTPGGHALPFHASTRIKLTGGGHIKNKDDEIIGAKVTAKTIKNKVAFPQRKVTFEIHFGKGLSEAEYIFDILRESPKFVNGTKTIDISGTGSWKKLEVIDSQTGEVITEKKFYKAEFGHLMKDKNYAKYINDYLEHIMIKKFNITDESEKNDDKHEL